MYRQRYRVWTGMPNISETSVSDISLSPACSVMIIFLFEWYWEAQRSFESALLPERWRPHDAVVVSTTSASVDRRSICAFTPLPLLLARADSASAGQFAANSGWTSGQTCPSKALSREAAAGGR